MKDDGFVRCDHCNTPVARIVAETLVIEDKHYGEKHTTVISLKDILARMLSVTVDREK